MTDNENNSNQNDKKTEKNPLEDHKKPKPVPPKTTYTRNDE